MSPGSDGAAQVLGGRWLVGPEIGRGGALLQRARDLRTGAIVALKRPRPDADPSLWRAEAQAEADRLASLRHPAIVRLHTLDQVADLPVLALQYLPGPDLRTLLQPGRAIAPAAAARLLDGAAGALAWLHRQGWVHGDIKPANLVCDARGMSVLVDFATARPIGTTAPTRVLTPAYAAPGQWRAAPADPRDDIYALAVIAYELIAARHPFARRPVQKAEQAARPAALAASGSRAAAWDGLCAALAEDAAARPADARAVAAALRASLSLPQRLFARRGGGPGQLSRLLAGQMLSESRAQCPG